MPKTYQRQFEAREQTHPFYTTLPESLRNHYFNKKQASTTSDSGIRVSTLPRLSNEESFTTGTADLENGFDQQQYVDDGTHPTNLRETLATSVPAVNSCSELASTKIGTYRVAARYPAVNNMSVGQNMLPVEVADNDTVENGMVRPTSEASGRMRASPVQVINDDTSNLSRYAVPHNVVKEHTTTTTNTTTASSGSSQIGSLAANAHPITNSELPVNDSNNISDALSDKPSDEKRPASSFYGLWVPRRRPQKHRPVPDTGVAFAEVDYVQDRKTHRTDSEKPKGCWISPLFATIAACLLLLAIVAVGLIVGLLVAAGCRSSSNKNSETALLAAPGVSKGFIYDPNMGDNKEQQALQDDPILASLFAEDANTAATRAEESNKQILRDIRLPNTILPVHYKVELYPQLEPNFRFTGQVEIDFRVPPKNRDVREVVLHAGRLLTVSTADARLVRLSTTEATNTQPTTAVVISTPSNDSAVVNTTIVEISQQRTTNKAPDTDIAIERIEQDTEREFLRIIPRSGSLQPLSEYRLFLRFSGNLTDDLKGIYRSSYKNSEGKIVWLMASQMQPTDARKVFPLFDEPALKATYQVTLVHDPRFSSIANMELVRQEQREDGLVADIYNTSVPMSSYLLAFVISDFRYREAVSERGTRLRIWARPNAIQHTEYAMEFTKKVLNYFEDYFQIPFPLSKLDQIAVPDFSAGAMENWGLITYREAALLFDPQTGSVNNKQRIATVIAHELAHQWFGNLVSPKWWDDLWLNEGFATYLEYVGQDFAHPDWKVMQQFVANDMQQTLKADALVTSHPISLPVYNPDEISEIFDSISYGKGAALIRMMRYFLGEQTMRRGLSQYLRNFTYDAATQDDLWWHLTQAAEEANLRDVDVKTIMDSWTLQMGYPVVTMSRTGDTSAPVDDVTVQPLGSRSAVSTSEIKVSQQHFLINPNAKVLLASPYNYTWRIPLTMLTQKNADFREFERSGHERVKWMATRNMTINDIYVDEDEWFLANVLETGYYRVNYDEKNWYLLSRQLKQGRNEIHVINRAQLVDDAMALAQASLLSYNVALDIVDYLIKEQEYLPWEAAFASFNYIDDMMRSTPDYGLMQRYMLKQLRPVFMSLGWTEDPNDSILTQKLRVDVISGACYYGLDECIHNAKRQFRAWMADSTRNPIANNLKTAVYCTAIREGGTHEWNFAWNEYKSSNVATEQTKLLHALSCSKEPWILSRYLQKALEETDIKRQDASKVISYVSGSPVGRYLAWPFFVNNYDKLRERFGSSFFSFAVIIKELTEDINSEYAYNELKEFVKRHRNELATGKRAFKQAIERAEANLRWTAKNVDTITLWLKHNVDGQ